MGGKKGKGCPLCEWEERGLLELFKKEKEEEKKMLRSSIALSFSLSLLLSFGGF